MFESACAGRLSKPAEVTTPKSSSGCCAQILDQRDSRLRSRLLCPESALWETTVLGVSLTLSFESSGEICISELTFTFSSPVLAVSSRPALKLKRAGWLYTVKVCAGEVAKFAKFRCIC